MSDVPQLAEAAAEEEVEAGSDVSVVVVVEEVNALVVAGVEDW